MAEDGYFDESSTDNSIVQDKRMSLRGRGRPPKEDKRLRNKNDELKFLQNFDPEKSNRERRKITRRFKGSLKNTIYDDAGIMRCNGLDICDCMNDDCVGCWTECSSCGSFKCGPTCRSNRKFMYEEITYDGKDATIKNKYFVKK